MTSPPDITDQKNAARKAAKLKRAEAAAALGTGLEIADAIRDRLLHEVGLADTVAKGATVAGYWPVGTELDVRPILAHFDLNGFACALPVVVARGQPLLFRTWDPETRLETAGYGLLEPAAGVPEVEPDVLLVPLLAFDRAGFRLGYGAGFYDRTLDGLRRRRPVIAVGVGYAAQEMAAVPRDGYDQPLDWIVTEQFALKIS